MDKNEIEKRMNAAVDLVTWLDQRIEQQVQTSSFKSSSGLGGSASSGGAS